MVSLLSIMTYNKMTVGFAQIAFTINLMNSLTKMPISLTGNRFIEYGNFEIENSVFIK